MDKQETREENFGWATRDGRVVHISEVFRGLKCGCICSECGSRLVARKGLKRKHHFAHESSDVCLNAGETGLHKAAKGILVRRKEIVLPDVRVEYGYIKPSRSFDGHEIDIENAFSDKNSDDNFSSPDDVQKQFEEDDKRAIEARQRRQGTA